MTDYDVAIVGASIAGSTAATLLARQGLRVALVEKSPDPNHYKHLCTHELIGTAVPVLARLGIEGELREIGGPHASPEIWSRYGWARAEPAPGGELTQSLNVRREKMDPIVRRTAAETDGVELIMGANVTGVLTGAADRPIGLRYRSGGADRELTARVVVGADGRASTLAKLTGIKARVKPHARFGYGAYFANTPLKTGTTSQTWFKDPDMAYAFPTDSGLTLLAISPVRTPERLAPFKENLEEAFYREFEGLVDGPDPRGGQLVGKFFGALKVENKRRPAAAPGVAFIGDAAQTSDYVWGTGCGFAFRSAEWLADAIGGALASGADDAAVDKALVAYRRTHRKHLAVHHLMISDYSSGRRFSLPERILYDAGTVDPASARVMHEMGERSAPPHKLITPPVIARAAAFKLRKRLLGPPAPAAVSSRAWAASTRSTSGSHASSDTVAASPS